LLAFFGVCADDAAKRLAYKLIPLYCGRLHNIDQVRKTIGTWRLIGAEREAGQLAHEVKHFQVTKAPRSRRVKARLVRNDRNAPSDDPGYKIIIDN